MESCKLGGKQGGKLGGKQGGEQGGTRGGDEGGKLGGKLSEELGEDPGRWVTMQGTRKETRWGMIKEFRTGQRYQGVPFPPGGTSSRYRNLVFVFDIGSML